MSKAGSVVRFHRILAGLEKRASDKTQDTSEMKPVNRAARRAMKSNKSNGKQRYLKMQSARTGNL